MSIDSINFDEKLYEDRKQEAINQAQKMVQEAAEWSEKPVSDEDFKRLAEENLKNEWTSLEWWQIIKRTKMFVGREDLLKKEIERLKTESHEENLKTVDDLKYQLNSGEINIEVNKDRTPVKIEK